MLVVLALLLMLEGFSSGVRFARFIPIFEAYSSFTIVALAVRAGVGMVQFASGWMLLQRRPFGSTLGRAALVTSAVLTSLELGFHLTPTSLFPSYRGPAIALYWVYAIAGLWVLRTRTRRL